MPNYRSAAERQAQINALARAIQAEAQNDSFESQLSVGNNIMNRAAAWGTTPKKQVNAGAYTGLRPLGSGGSILGQKGTPLIASAVRAATAVVDGTVPDNTGGGLFYNTEKNDPRNPIGPAGRKREREGTYTAKNLGGHNFYNMKNVTEREKAAVRDRFANPSSYSFNPAMSAAQMAIDNGIKPVIGMGGYTPPAPPQEAAPVPTRSLGAPQPSVQTLASTPRLMPLDKSLFAPPEANSLRPMTPPGVPRLGEPSMMAAPSPAMVSAVPSVANPDRLGFMDGLSQAPAPPTTAAPPQSAPRMNTYRGLPGTAPRNTATLTPSAVRSMTDSMPGDEMRSLTTAAANGVDPSSAAMFRPTERQTRLDDARTTSTWGGTPNVPSLADGSLGSLLNQALERAPAPPAPAPLSVTTPTETASFMEQGDGAGPIANNPPLSPRTGRPIAPPNQMSPAQVQSAYPPSAATTLGGVARVGADTFSGARKGAAFGLPGAVMGAVAGAATSMAQGPSYDPRSYSTPATKADIVPNASPTVLQNVNAQGFGPAPEGYRYGYSSINPSKVATVLNGVQGTNGAIQSAAEGPGPLGQFMSGWANPAAPSVAGTGGFMAGWSPSTFSPYSTSPVVAPPFAMAALAAGSRGSIGNYSDLNAGNWTGFNGGMNTGGSGPNTGTGHLY